MAETTGQPPGSSASALLRNRVSPGEQGRESLSYEKAVAGQHTGQSSLLPPCQVRGGGGSGCLQLDGPWPHPPPPSGDRREREGLKAAFCLPGLESSALLSAWQARASSALGTGAAAGREDRGGGGDDRRPKAGLPQTRLWPGRAPHKGLLCGADRSAGGGSALPAAGPLAQPCSCADTLSLCSGDGAGPEVLLLSPPTATPLIFC